jgi:hypothetical protein
LPQVGVPPASSWTVRVPSVCLQGVGHVVCMSVCVHCCGWSAQVMGPIGSDPVHCAPMHLLPAHGSSAPEAGTPAVCNCMEEGVVCCKACSHALKCSNEGRAPAQSGSQGPSIPPLFLIITWDPMLFDSFVLRHMCFDPGEAALRGVGGVNLTIIAARAPCDVSYMPSRLGETCTMRRVGHPQ